MYVPVGKLVFVLRYNAGDVDFEARAGDGAIGVEVDGDGGGIKGAEGGLGIDAVVGPEDGAAGAHAFVDGDVVVGGLGVGGTTDCNILSRGVGQEDQGGIAVAGVVSIGTAVVVDGGAAGAKRVAAGGGHVVHGVRRGLRGRSQRHEEGCKEHQS